MPRDATMRGNSHPFEHADFTMTTFTTYLSDDHARCDDLFTLAENAVGVKDWGRAKEHFTQFRDGMRHHFALEEDVLFPAFENRTGMNGGPTYVMRAEHQQINSLLADMGNALEQADGAAYLNLSETLLMLMRQHNLKEENILYPMTDQALEGEREDLLAQMRSVTH